MDYRAPRWLIGGNAQTIWPAIYLRRQSFGSEIPLRRERWDSPDGDFIDVDWLAPPALQQPAANRSVEMDGRPLLVLFHGLEGSSSSHYARAFARDAARRGWGYAVPHFRGCSGEANRLPRAYHSGDHAEIDWVLRRFRASHRGPLFAVGISLGGNALMLWAGLQGTAAASAVDAVASVCAPLDLTAAGHAIGRGFGRRTYTPMFLKTMKAKAFRMLAQFPELFDARTLAESRTLYQFDGLFTAPLHGFSGADDYWRRASAKPALPAVRLPALLLNTLNDPFVPANSLPPLEQLSPQTIVWRPAGGGHVGFAQGRFAHDVQALPRAVSDWFASQAGAESQKNPE